LAAFQKDSDPDSNYCSSADSRGSSQDQGESSPSSRSPHFHEKKICFKGRLSAYSDFKVIRMLGQGAFGKVFLVQRKLTKDLYAMKVIELKSSLDKQVLHDLITEHEIFKKIGG